MRSLLILALAFFSSMSFAQDRVGKVVLYRAAAELAVAEVSTVATVADVGGALGGTYFDVSNAGDVVRYRVWIDVDNGSTAPSSTGVTLLEVNIAEDATDAQVATAVAAALDALPAFGAAAVAEDVTITNADKGAATDIAAGTSGFTVGVTTQGVSSALAIPSASVVGNVIGWKVCNDAVNTSTALYVGKAVDSSTDGVHLGKGKCLECADCKQDQLKALKVSAQAAANGYSVVQYQK